MNTRSLLPALWLLAGFALVAPGAEQVTLDVETAVLMAKENNLSVRSARIDLETRERERKASWNELLPSLGAGASLTHAQTVTSRGLTDPFPWGLSATVSASVPLANSIRFSMRGTELEYEAELTSLSQTEKQLERDVRKSFYALLLKLENIRLLEDSQETARKRLEQVSTSYEYGLASELDRLNAQVNLENVKPQLQKARTDYETATMQFKFTLGLDRTVEVVLEGEIGVEGIPLDPEELIRTYGTRRFEVLTLLHELAIQENSRKLVAAQELQPALNLSYSFRAAQSDPFSAAGWAGAGYSGTSSLSVSFSMPLDGLIPSSASQIRLAGIDDSIRKTSLALVEARARGEITIESLVLNLERSAVAIEVLQKNAALAERVYELTQQEYEAGLTDLLTLEQSYADLQQARVNVLTEQYNYQSLLLDLEYELDADLEG
jgi:multidrug efflux system outer membrane protein